MKIKYITIEREYGSGGTEIAKRTAEELGIKSYGREIMELVAEKEKVSIKELEDYEGKVSNSIIYSMFVVSQSETGNPDLLSEEAKLFVAETRVIKKLSLEGPCIFVGHCASHVLREKENVLRVFIRSSKSEKHRRIVEEYGVPDKEVRSTMKKFNKKRANYYSFCTNKKWDDLDNYDIVLNSSKLGIEGCIKVLSSIYLASQKKD